MKIIYPEGTIAWSSAYYENWVICYSWFSEMVMCFNENGNTTHIFNIKK